jgi:hypothetical protein
LIVPSLEDLPLFLSALTVLVLVLARAFRKPASAPTPALPPVDTKPVEQKAEEKKAEAKAELDEERASISEQHKEEQAKDLKEREEQVPVLIGDPEKLNEELKKTGKMIRDSQHGRRV